jgi:hypothetical protein
MTDTGPFAWSAEKLAAAWGDSARQTYDLCARGDGGHVETGGV